MANKPDEAVVLLRNVVQTRFSSKGAKSAKPIIKQLDLAAGLAIRYDLSIRLEEIVRLATDMQYHISVSSEKSHLVARHRDFEGLKSGL